MAINKKLRAWVRYDGKNRVVAGSLILQAHKPKDGKWKELPVYKCCNATPTPPIDLPLFLSRMNSCYRAVTALIPNKVYFGDGNGDLGLPNYIGDGCDDMYDDGNMYNTNLTQLYANIIENNGDYALNIPYTHTQDSASYNVCNYTNPPIDGTINSGDNYFGAGSTYFTNMYPGMFIMAATGVNVKEFSITGDLGSDGQATNAVYVDLFQNHDGWKVFIKTNDDNGGSGDPSVNHIILVNGDTSGATQLYDNTGAYDDHCIKGLTVSNSTIITAIVSTQSGTPALTEEQAVRIANTILDVYEYPCDNNYTTSILFDDIANADILVGDASVVGDWNTFFDLPAYGNPFTSVVIDGNQVQLTGGYTIEVKSGLFRDYQHIIEVNDNGAFVILGDESFGGPDGTSSLQGFIGNNVVTTIGDPANYGVFGQCYDLANVFLPNCVNLGACTFYTCSSLTQAGLNLPFDQITRIADFTFTDVTQITDINIYTSLTYIEDFAFQNCFGLTTIDLPLVTYIGNASFQSCNITSVDLPLVTEIGDSAFYDCSLLASINVPNAITVGNVSFRNCIAASIFNFPNATTIIDGAFYDCSSATTINIPSCTALGNNTLDNFVFFGITGNTITLTVPSALMTCNSGNPDGDIEYLQANNTVTVITV